MKYAILIDGGFIKRKLGSQAAPLDATGVLAFLDALRAHVSVADMHLHRVYWYDAPPLQNRVNKPLSGGSLDLAKTPLGRANTTLIDQLSRSPHFSIRRGDLAFRGWRVKRDKLPFNGSTVILTAADLEPNIHQKGVDMRLGLDIAALTLKAHVSAIVLVAGDSDFVPAMKFARREGAQLFLVTLGHTVRSDMHEHSDLVLTVPFTIPIMAGTQTQVQAQTQPQMPVAAT